MTREPNANPPPTSAPASRRWSSRIWTACSPSPSGAATRSPMPRTRSRKPASAHGSGSAICATRRTHVPGSTASSHGAQRRAREVRPAPAARPHHAARGDARRAARRRARRHLLRGGRRGSTRKPCTRALAEIPEDFATAVELHDIDGFKYIEIADIVGVPIGTVMSRIARGRKLLAGAILAGQRTPAEAPAALTSLRGAPCAEVTPMSDNQNPLSSQGESGGRGAPRVAPSGVARVARRLRRP